MDQETWVNNSRGKVGVNKFGPDGRTPIQQLISSGKSVHLSPEERKILNQERCASEKLDPFVNGVLSPVRLVTASEISTADNPNHLAESDLPDLFELHWTKFDDRLGEISSHPLLERLLELADGDEVNATVRQREAVVARLTELGGSVHVQEIDQVGRTMGSATGEDDRSTVTAFRGVD